MTWESTKTLGIVPVFWGSIEEYEAVATTRIRSPTVGLVLECEIHSI